METVPKELAIHSTLAKLLLGSFGCTLLLLLRMLTSGKNTFDFMLYNLALAWIPYGLYLATRWSKSRLINIVLLFTWFIFIPNASYLVTDLIHLKARDTTPIWYDALMLQAFAVAGLLLHTYSLEPIHSSLQRNYGVRTATYTVCILTFLISFGVAVGRFLRLNSWDLFVSPQRIVTSFLQLMSQSKQLSEVVAYTIFFFFFLLGSYAVLHRVTRRTTV